ncbi:MAG: TatD family hydrolase [Candidatus Levybacteria bacterium]|nr:TatD family hydrolase [Candidatus Levybacteria bacterium]
MIDVHCHLNFHAYKNDVDAVIREALKNGLTRIINVGTKIDSSGEAVKLAEKYDELYAIVGVHPHHADKHEENWLASLDTLATHPKVIGIGECGMDYYHYKSNGIVDPKQQKEIFIKQIELAYKHKLPLQIHNRQAGADVVDILKAHKRDLLPIPGMFHCLAVDIPVLDQLLDLGFFVGFDGNITYPGLAPGETTDLRDLALHAPLDRIVLETDSPFLTPIPHRGKRNTPSYVIIVAEYIAGIRHLPVEQVIAQTTKNVYTIFRKMAK